MRPDVNFAMVEMHMDGFDPPLQLIEAGAGGRNLKLPMAGRWVVNVGFAEDFAEVESMRSDGPTQQVKEDDTLRRGLLRGTAVGVALFAVLGTVTAVWANPLFVRMTPVGPWEFGATVLTALLAGVTVALWVSRCRLRTSGQAVLRASSGSPVRPATRC